MQNTSRRLPTTIASASYACKLASNLSGFESQAKATRDDKHTALELGEHVKSVNSRERKEGKEMIMHCIHNEWTCYAGGDKMANVLHFIWNTKNMTWCLSGSFSQFYSRRVQHTTHTHTLACMWTFARSRILLHVYGVWSNSGVWRLWLCKEPHFVGHQWRPITTLRLAIQNGSEKKTNGPNKHYCDFHWKKKRPKKQHNIITHAHKIHRYIYTDHVANMWINIFCYPAIAIAQENRNGSSFQHPLKCVCIALANAIQHNIEWICFSYTSFHFLNKYIEDTEQQQKYNRVKYTFWLTSNSRFIIIVSLLLFIAALSGRPPKSSMCKHHNTRYIILRCLLSFPVPGTNIFTNCLWWSGDWAPHPPNAMDLSERNGSNGICEATGCSTMPYVMWKIR